jgi:DNA polymerase-3 subunit alpha
VLESLAASGAFDRLEPNRARAFAAIDSMLAAAQRTHEAVSVGQNELFGGSTGGDALAIPAAEAWLPADRLRREYDAIGFFLSGHPLDDYAALLKGMKVQSWAEFSRAVKSGVNAGRVAATVVSRVERRTKTGNKMGIIGLSDPSGHYEAVLFAEGLQQYRDLLEPGSPVLLGLTAEAQGDEIRARIQSAEPLDAAAARLQKGLKVFLRDCTPIEPVAKRLEGKGDGEISMVLLLDGGNEVEVRLPGRFKISPQIAGAIKAVPGVVQVEMM